MPGGSVSTATLSKEWEEGLIASAAGGDEAAFTKLYDHYFDRIYRHICYRVGQTQDAEDLTQQVFLQAWRALGRYQQTGSPFVAWLLTIAHNAVVSYYRRTKNVKSLDLEVMDWPSEERVDHQAETRVEYQRVRRVLQRLKPEHQQIIVMRFLEDLSHRDIATALGKSEANVRVMQHRALHELRKMLDKEELL
jgi:RNA polymerase sigma-70 factor (ECF subfamily)